MLVDLSVNPVLGLPGAADQVELSDERWISTWYSFTLLGSLTGSQARVCDPLQVIESLSAGTCGSGTGGGVVSGGTSVAQEPFTETLALRSRFVPFSRVTLRV